MMEINRALLSFRFLCSVLAYSTLVPVTLYAQVSASGFAGAVRSGVALAQQGKLAEAEQQFRTAVSLRPSDPEALTGLGQVEELQGKIELSLETFRSVIQLDPTSSEAHVNLAIALADHGDMAAGLEQGSLAVQMSPNSASAHFLRGRLLLDLGKRPEAKLEFERVLQIKPHFPDATLHLAEIAGDEGDLSTQADLLTSYTRLRPSEVTPMSDLGRVLYSQHHSSEAIVLWKRALAIDPSYAPALYALARALRQVDPQESQQLMERLSKEQTDRHRLDQIKLLGNQANQEMAAGRSEAAIHHLHEALNLCEQCALAGVLHKNLGLAYCRSGSTDLGRRELHLAAALIPDDPDIPKALSIAERQ